MFASLLEEAIDAWSDARYGVIAELDNLPADRFDYRPTSASRTVAELAVHIMEVSEFMVGELCREDTNFRRMPMDDLIAEHAGDIQGLRAKDELLEAMHATLDEGRARFREVGELHMMQWIERFDGLRGTRLAWMHHGIAQEMYHRGQLALYARMMGYVPALTRRIHGDA